MAKVLATEIRIGHLLEWEKRIWRVIKCYHVHVGGRGGAFMQVEMKDIESGTKTNQRIRTEDKVERAFVDPREMQYLYNDGTGYVFMDKENYEQLTLSDEMLEGQTGYLLPNTDVQVVFYNDKPIGVELPPSVVLTVTETDPNIRNATVTTSFKPAKTETGLIVQVPPFVNSGEKIKVNTNDGASSGCRALTCPLLPRRGVAAGDGVVRQFRGTLRCFIRGVRTNQMAGFFFIAILPC